MLERLANRLHKLLTFDPVLPRPAPPRVATEAVGAEVVSIDHKKGTVLLNHSAIESLDLPAMRMVYRVRDSAMSAVSQLEPGQRIQFTPERENGRYYVRSLNSAPETSGGWVK